MKNKNLVVVYLARTYQWLTPTPLINLAHIECYEAFFFFFFLVIYYTVIKEFSIFSKNYLYPFLKINPPYNTTPLWNQNFLTHPNRFFGAIFLPHFKRRGAHGMITKSAGSPKKTPSEHDSMIAKFCKNVYQNTYLNNFRLRRLFDFTSFKAVIISVACKKGNYS